MTRPRPGRAVAARLGLALALAAASSCYRPDILNGGFKCASEGKPCPDGFVCDAPTNTCRRPGTLTDGGPDLAPDATIKDAASDPRPDVSEAPCFMAVSGCSSSDAGVCDPYCRSGCGCHEKCSVAAGALGCHEPMGGPATDLCDIAFSGTPGQTDNCGPGFVCAPDHCGDNRCARFCRTNADCPNATCSIDVGGGATVCSVAFASCVPVGGAATTSCGNVGALSCYVSAVMPDRVVCDCPTGSSRVGDTCAATVDCVPGALCTLVPGDTMRTCRQVCTLGTAGTCMTCTSARFMAYNGSATYGYCY